MQVAEDEKDIVGDGEQGRGGEGDGEEREWTQGD